MKKKITWLLFHEPAELFIRTAEHFEQELNAQTNNAYEFEILELADYEAEYCDGKPCDPLEELRSGRVQMSQLYIESLAQANVTNFLALSLPYLFRDHSHATRVFEGKIGTELLAHVQDTIGIKGLSFTYSGGYKCMAVNQPVTSVEDFSRLTYKARTNSVGVDIFNALGARLASFSKVLPVVTKVSFLSISCLIRGVGLGVVVITHLGSSPKRKPNIS